MSKVIPPESEKQFMAAIIDLAQRLGYRCYHSWSSLHSAAGYPDLTLCHGQQQRLIFAEIKTAKGRFRPDQRLWLDDLGQCPPAEVFVWRAGTDSLASIAEILRGGN